MKSDNGKLRSQVTPTPSLSGLLMTAGNWTWRANRCAGVGLHEAEKDFEESGGGGGGARLQIRGNVPRDARQGLSRLHVILSWPPSLSPPRQVNEFATNLREGKVELPLDDRSANLLKENKWPSLTPLPPPLWQDNRKLREDIRVLSLKNERYELEISGGGGAGQISEQLMEMMAQASSKNSNHSEVEFAGQFFSLPLSPLCRLRECCDVSC
jgi:hypothetical protein